MNLSYTRVETYLDCPQRYKFKYVDRIHEEPRPELEFGKLIHKILEFIHDPRNLTIPGVDLVMEKYEQSWASLPEVEGLEPYRQVGREMLRNYYSAHVPGPDEVLAVEQKFRLPMDDHRLVGVMDRVDRTADGTIVITDYKTSKRLPTQPDLARNKQVVIYHHSAGKLYPDHPALVRLHFLKFDFFFESVPDRDAWTEVKGELLRAAYGIEGGHFSPKPGSICEYCGYVNLCPAMRHLFEARGEESEARGGVNVKQAVREYVRLKENIKESEAKIDELSKQIKAYMDEKGFTRLFVDEILLSRTKMRKWMWDEDKLAAVLEKLGILREVLGIKYEKLRELLDSETVSEDKRRDIESCRRSRQIDVLRYRFRDEVDN
jgi:putative RecB family exonuclease